MIINSRYKLIEPLGKGRSNVYLIEDLKLPGKKFALKIIPHETLNSDEIESLKNEFRLLNALNHPNVVKAYEFDKVRICNEQKLIGSYFFVSEFVDGKNLLEFFQPPLIESKLNLFIDLLSKICNALYYIHQLGIIHYDIRPENILIDERYREQLNIKIIDFGFSALKDERVKGTPLYISPELILGKDVDYRTDLYSLGATLFHTITGKPPFEAKNEIELFRKHLDENPPNIPVDKYPKFLVEIVSKLLRKNPAERFRNSLEIIEYLPDEYKHSQKIWPIPKIYFAREKEFQKLKDFIEDENKNFALIISEKGMGKTYLIKKLIETLDDNNKIYFYLSSTENKTSSFNLLFDLINQIERLIVERDFSTREEIIHKINNLKLIYSEPSKIVDFEENQQSNLSEIVLRIAKEFKFILIIDDFQNLDATAKKFFYFIYPSLIDRGTKIILSVETLFIRSEEIEKFKFDEEIILLPLSKQEIINILKAYFNFNFPYEEVADILVDYTDKSVKEINDFLSTLILTEILFYDSKGFRVNTQKLKNTNLENLLNRTYENRFNALNKNQRNILEFLSLVEFPLKVQQLCELISLDVNKLKEEIYYLNSFGWIEYNSWDDFVFLPKGGIKNYLRKNTLFDKALNLKLARYLVRYNYPNYIIAELFERSGEKNLGMEYYLAAARDAEKFFSYSSMEKYLLKSILLEEDDEKIACLKYKLAVSYFYQSEYYKARNLILEIIDKECLEAEKQFNLALMQAIIAFKTGEVDAAYEYFDKAFKLALNDSQRIEVELNQINLEISQGNFLFAKKKCENLLYEFSEALSNANKAAIYNNLGITNSQLGLLDEAIEFFERSLEIYTEQKNKSKSSQVLLNLGNVYNLLGNREKSLSFWREALEINDTIGDLSKKALIINNIGISMYESLEFEEAIKYYEEAKLIFERINDYFGKSLVLFNLAETLFLLCDYEKSLYYIKEALSLSEKLIDIEGQCQSLFLMGMIYYLLNHNENLISTSEQLLNIIESNKLQSTHLQYYLYLSGLIESEKKNFEEAIVKLELSRELFRENDGKYFYCKCTLDLMSLYSYVGNFDFIKKLFNELKDNPYFQKNKSLGAEAFMILGDASRKPGANFQQKPIYYYMEALNELEKSYINEATWQVLLAAGEEYLSLGVVRKGLDLVKQAQLVIGHLISKFENSEYKNLYLAHTKRARAIKKINKIMKSYLL